MTTRLYTIEATSPEVFLNMMKSVKSQVMRLKMYCVHLDLSTIVDNVPFNSVSVEIGNVINSDFVIDNDVGRYYFKLVLDSSNVDANNVQRSLIQSCDIPLMMGSDLDQNYWFRVRDPSNNDVVFSSDVLKYIFLQFELSE